MDNQPYSQLKNHFENKKMEKIIRNNEASTIRQRLGSFVDMLEWILLPLLILWTATCSGAFVYLNLAKMTDSFLIAILASIIVITIIEGLKLYGGLKLVSSFTQGWFLDGKHYYILLFPVFLLCIFSYAGSVYLALKGSPALSARITENKANTPTLATKSIEDINKRWDEQIQQERGSKTAALSTKWKGTTTAKGLETAKTVQQNINKMEENRAREVELAINENAKTQSDKEQFTTAWGNWLAGFGGWAEALQVVILFLSCFYERTVYLEEHNVKQHISLPLQKSMSQIKQQHPPAQEINNRSQIRMMGSEKWSVPEPITPAENIINSVITADNAVITDITDNSVITDPSDSIKNRLNRIQTYKNKILKGEGFYKTNLTNIQSLFSEIKEISAKNDIQNDLKQYILRVSKEVGEVILEHNKKTVTK